MVGDQSRSKKTSGHWIAGRPSRDTRDHTCFWDCVYSRVVYDRNSSPLIARKVLAEVSSKAIMVLGFPNFNANLLQIETGFQV
ncbi:hypothetical protein SLA2020_312560 [Shorea laevis]